MPIITQDLNNISTIHTAERLQINLLTAKENVEEMYIEVFFIIETQLPNGKVIGFPHRDNKPLILNCKNDEELTQAMLVIQNRIGVNRYLQLTTPKEEVEPLEPLIPQ
jgi:hypothetical protein